MTAIAQMIGTETELLFNRALEKAADKIAGNTQYSGSEAIRQFKISRKDLDYIKATYLPPRSKPVYLAKHVMAYQDRNTKLMGDSR